MFVRVSNLRDEYPGEGNTDPLEALRRFDANQPGTTQWRNGHEHHRAGQDGSRSDTGKVLAWDPPRGVVLAWQLTGGWQYDETFITELEVRFVPEGPNRTRV